MEWSVERPRMRAGGKWAIYVRRQKHMALVTVYWFWLQLVSYGIAWWLIFFGITALGAWRYGLRGLVVSHLLVATVIVVLDIQWILSEMRKPGWSGTPDMDIVFQFGVVLRIVLINSALLPVGFFAVLRHRSIRSPNQRP